jgi:hypothetical protein
MLTLSSIARHRKPSRRRRIDAEAIGDACQEVLDSSLATIEFNEQCRQGLADDAEFDAFNDREIAARKLLATLSAQVLDRTSHPQEEPVGIDADEFIVVALPRELAMAAHYWNGMIVLPVRKSSVVNAPTA